MLRGVLGTVLIVAAILVARAMAGGPALTPPTRVPLVAIVSAETCAARTPDGSLGGRGGGPGPARRIARSSSD